MADAAPGVEDVAARIRACVSAGVDRVQLRDRTLEGADWLAFAEAIARAARSASTDVEIVVNRRVDVALAIGADGVHLGFDALSVADARALLGAGVRIGVSTHGVEEVARAHDEGADYVHLAPIFDPISKAATRAALGVDVLAEAARIGVPVFAQGGLRPDRCAAVVAAGAAGVAVTGAVLAATDAVDATRRLRAALDAPSSAHTTDAPA